MRVVCGLQMAGTIQRLDFNGSSNLGAFCRVTDHWLLQALSNEPTRQALESLFGMRPVVASLGQSTLVGILTVGNANGLLVPHYTLEEELEALRESLELPVVPLDSRLTALGNLILTNDRAALISPEFTADEVQVIRDTLGVEVEARTIAGSDLVGSYCVVTNRGLLAHPQVTEEELEELSDFFGVRADVGTINCGVPYVSIGLLANTKAAAAGYETTGPELMRISEILLP